MPGPVRDGDSQHVGVQLQVNPVHQSQWAELLFGQLAREPSRHLIAKLRDPLRDEGVIEFIVAVHEFSPLLRVSNCGWTGDRRPLSARET